MENIIYRYSILFESSPSKVACLTGSTSEVRIVLINLFRAHPVRPDSAVVKWIKKNTIERLSFAISSQEGASDSQGVPHIWKERQAAEADVKAYLSDFPGRTKLYRVEPRRD